MIHRPLRIGSLNARSIFKESNSITRNTFISHLKSTSLGLDILCLQETSTLSRHNHITDDQLLQFTRFMFPNCSSILTKHVAIICLQQHLSLDSTLVSMDERVVLASIVDHHQHTLCHIINTYVPAQDHDRQEFLRSFHDLPFIQAVNTGPWLLLGDFNLNMHSKAITRQAAVQPWAHWIMLHFDNCFPEGLPTFKQRNARTTIDYIFAHRSLRSRLTNPTSSHLPNTWTDHNLMMIDLLPERQDFGPGCWRFNPTLLLEDDFVQLLDQTIDSFFDILEHSTTSLSPQEQWEQLKHLLQCTAHRHTKGATTRKRHKLAQLQHQRQVLLSSSAPIQLAQVEKQIETLIDTDTRQIMLRSATRWHEKGERNNKYFYRVIKSRQLQQTIQSLKCPQSNSVLHRHHDIIQAARGFYQQLYTPDDMDSTALNQLLANVPAEVKLSDTDADDLIARLHIPDLIDLVSRTPTGKSPGLDGLPFELYRHLITRSKAFASLLLQVMRDAFDGNFPPSWLKTRMVLLYKKGDPELLGNWRPLSLINTDAKLFTKLVANRLNEVLPRLINPYQTGFLPHRLISDNGWINQVLINNTHLNNPSRAAVAVFLDQEKAYDRVHPAYLRQVLLHFGFPTTLVSSLCKLFFGTQIHISINGWLGAPIEQGRGLRQGDPLSPLLFNLAFEPLLRSILASPLSGVSLSHPPLPSRLKPNPAMVKERNAFGSEKLDFISSSLLQSPSPIKMLSYADDLEVFLTSPTEWQILMHLLELYHQASNAKVNLSKTVVMPLSGEPQQDWITLAEGYGAQWHDSTKDTALVYLGYPLFHNQSQLMSFLDKIKTKITHHAHILKARNLSIRGASMVANSLLLSRLWHVLRVVPVPSKWLQEIKALVRSFLLPFWPKPAWDTLTLPRAHGGVGLIDIEQQSKALHFVYLQRMCKHPRTTDFLTPWIIKYYQLLTGHASLLPWFLFPKHYRTQLKTDPNMLQLCSVLQSLPPLTISSSWSQRWLLDLPLENSITPLPNHHKLPIRYLLSDIVFWDQDHQCFFFHTHQLPKLLRNFVQSLPQADQVAPTILTLNNSTPISIPAYNILAPLSTAPPPLPKSRLPSLAHWTLQVSNRTCSTVPTLTLTQLRRSWHPHWKLMLSRPRPPEIPRPLCFLYPSSFWKRFWRSEIPHKAFTPWWRLLHDTIGTRQKLHRWNITEVDTPICQICKTHPEDLHHLFVDCPRKRLFWIEALQAFELYETFPTKQSIWTALHTLQSTPRSYMTASTIFRLGSIIAILWRYHWQCVLDNEEWCTTAVLNLLNAHILFSSSLLNPIV